MKPAKVAILGAGSWGTAIAIHLANCGNHVWLWGHRAEHIEQMTRERQNQQYLPAAQFPEHLYPNKNLEQCLEKAAAVIVAVPSHAFAEILQKLPKTLKSLAWLTKGIDPKSNRLLSDLVEAQYTQAFPMAMIAGPSFAGEVAHLLPTALTIASNSIEFQEQLRELFHQKNIRTYSSDDMIGVQLCGAVKNILAIACGISDGMNYGANAKAALITRGLAEMSRLGTRMGAKSDTFMGLAGVGDLVLTCTDNQSRNRRFGLLLGQGVDIDAAQKQIGQVVEGTYNAAQVCTLAQQFNIEMPICTVVHQLLQGQYSAQKAVEILMSRPPRDEHFAAC